MLEPFSLSLVCVCFSKKKKTKVVKVFLVLWPNFWNWACMHFRGGEGGRARKRSGNIWLHIREISGNLSISNLIHPLHDFNFDIGIFFFFFNLHLVSLSFCISCKNHLYCTIKYVLTFSKKKKCSYFWNKSCYGRHQIHVIGHKSSIQYMLLQNVPAH